MLSSVMRTDVKKHVRMSAAERRLEIIDATLDLLGRYGIEGTTVTRIAQAVGITPGALYRHFEGREALIDEANKVASERSTSWADASSEPDMLRRLEELGRAHYGWAMENLATVVRPFFLELASAGPDGAGRMSMPMNKLFQIFTVLAEEGKRQGTIGLDVPSQDVAWALLMFAWTEDIAHLVGAEDAIAEGAMLRNLQRMLQSFRSAGDTSTADQ
jgi:AcrR family transcriptional regulator